MRGERTLVYVSHVRLPCACAMLILLKADEKDLTNQIIQIYHWIVILGRFRLGQFQFELRYINNKLDDDAAIIRANHESATAE